MKVNVWHNNLGCDVRSGRLLLEVWEHGGIAHCERDDSACGYFVTHYSTIRAKQDRSWQEQAELALAHWKHNRNCFVKAA